MITEYSNVKKQISPLFRGCSNMSNVGIYSIIVLIVCSSSAAFAQAEAKNILRSRELESSRRVITGFFKKQAKVHYISNVVLNPAATVVAWSVEEPEGYQAIYRAFLSHPDSVMRISATSAFGKSANESDPQWSPDGRKIAFLSDAASPGQLQVFIADANATRSDKAKPLTRFDGYVSHLKWSPDGKYLSVLYVEKASREPSPMAAENKVVGLIDSILNRNVQRIAVVNRVSGKTVQALPANFYVFEYDWSPDNKKFVYTAAMPPGDDNWYIAQLYQQSIYNPDTILLYKPLRQIALPRWSPDGKRIAFIEGLMSDQGGTGGEIFVVSPAGGKPQNLTPKRPSTPSWFTWRSDSSMLFTEFTGGSVAFNTLNTVAGSVQNVWKAGESIRAGSEEMSSRQQN